MEARIKEEMKKGKRQEGERCNEEGKGGGIENAGRRRRR